MGTEKDDFDRRTYEAIKKNIKRLRLERGLTQEELGHKISSGQSYIYQLEKGKSLAGRSTLLKLANAFNVTLNDLIEEVPKYKGLKPIELRRENLIPVISWERAGKMRYPIGKEDYVSAPVLSEIADKNAFALRIEDDSMSPRFEIGDIIIISPQARVVDRDLALIRHDNEVLFRQITFREGLIILKAYNTKYADIFIEENQKGFHIIGKVVESLRRC